MPQRIKCSKIDITSIKTLEWKSNMRMRMADKGSKFKYCKSILTLKQILMSTLKFW